MLGKIKIINNDKDLQLLLEDQSNTLYIHQPGEINTFEPRIKRNFLSRIPSM